MKKLRDTIILLAVAASFAFSRGWWPSHQALLVPAFGSLLRRTPLRHLNPLVYLKQYRDPLIVQAQAESAEAAHLLAAALLLPYIVYAAAQGWWSAVAWLTLVQIAGNVYPILHLRWVRIRIKRLQLRNRAMTWNAVSRPY